MSSVGQQLWAQTDAARKAAANSPPDPTITGVVLDENGSAVPFALVRLLRVGVFRQVPRAVRTDEEGKFVFKRLPAGSYAIRAGKEEDGYAETIETLYTDQAPPTATIAAGLPTPFVTVRLGPKAGILDVLSVSDATTAKNVESASITIRRADNRVSITTHPSLGLFVPPVTKVFIEIHAAGYMPWFYPGYSDQLKSAPVALRPGERLPIIVSLEPLP